MVNTKTKIYKQHYKHKCKQNTQTTIRNDVYIYWDSEKPSYKHSPSKNSSDCLQFVNN